VAIAGIGVPQESVLLAMAIEEKDHIRWLSWMSSQQAIVEAGPQPVMHITLSYISLPQLILDFNYSFHF